MNKTCRTSQNGYKFFVLRRKLSNSESTNEYEDIFCVLHDSNELINQLDEDNTNKTYSHFRDETGLPMISNFLINDPNVKKKFNLKLFKKYLMTFFNVDLDSKIFYMDENNIKQAVQTETEFLRLWKLAKSYAKQNRGVLLLTDFTNDQNDDTSKDTISVANDQTFSRMTNIDFSEACQSDETIKEVKESNNARSNREYNSRIFHLEDESSNNFLQSTNNASTLFGNASKSNSVVLTKKIDCIEQERISSTNPVDLTEKMDYMEVESTVPFNINSQDFQNNVAPTWFVNYMKQLKKVIVKEVLDELKLYINDRHESNIPKEEYTQNTAIQNETTNKCDSVSSELAELELYVKNRYESNIPEEEYTQNTAIQNETSNKCDSISSELELYVKNHRESNIPEENECCTKYTTSKHQTVESNFKSETCRCGCDLENISISSDINNSEELYEEDNFEIIQTSSKDGSTCDYVSKASFLDKITPFKKKTKNRETKNRASVESLTKMPLSSSSPIYIDDSHFTACSNNVPTSSKNTNFNIPSADKSDEKNFTVYKDDNKKILQKHISNKCINTKVADLSEQICQNLLEMSSKSLLPKPETKNYVDPSKYRNFATTQSYCQADVNDLTENFHSHTASIAENCVHKGERNTSTSNDYPKHNLLDSNKPTNSKENRIHKQTNNNFNYQNSKKKYSKEESNTTYGSGFEDTSANSTPENAEPVHILPETLVTGAFNLASFAYGTARGAITKIRSNSKDD